MLDVFAPYAATVNSILALGGLFLVQSAVLDVTSIRAKHTPGMPVQGGHDNPLFRAARAHANTIENFAAFLAIALAGMLRGADPWWTNTLAVVFVAARLVHMVAYYADQRTLRSAGFAVGMLAMTAMFVAALIG